VTVHLVSLAERAFNSITFRRALARILLATPEGATAMAAPKGSTRSTIRVVPSLRAVNPACPLIRWPNLCHGGL
jgi:hypothetical protein